MDVEADKAMADGAGSEDDSLNAGPGVTVGISIEVDVDDMVAVDDTGMVAEADQSEEDAEAVDVGEGAASTAGGSKVLDAEAGGATMVSLLPASAWRLIPSLDTVSVGAIPPIGPDGASSACATPPTAGDKPSPSTREPSDLALGAATAVDLGR